MSSLAEPAPESRADPQSAACFSVSAEPSPGLLPRVTELFAKRGLVPDEIHARVADGRLTVGRCLRQIYLVERVLVSRDAPGDGA